MAIKESDDFSIDYEFLSKYIRDDSDKSKETNQSDFSIKKFESQKQNSNGTEILARDGEGESYSENTIANKKPWEKNKGFDESDESDESIEFDDSDEESDGSTEKIEFQSNISDAKKEFVKHLDDESLSIDTCTRINHDWEKK